MALTSACIVTARHIHRLKRGRPAVLVAVQTLDGGWSIQELSALRNVGGRICEPILQFRRRVITSRWSLGSALVMEQIKCPYMTKVS